MSSYSSKPKYQQKSASSMETKENEFKEFIVRQIGKFGISAGKYNDYVARLTSPEAMNMWKSCVTDSTITSVSDMNYEFYETIGDSFLNAFFYTYIRSRIPNEYRTPSYITDLRNYWLSTARLSPFAIKLGLTPFIRYDETLDWTTDELQKLNENVFEAFFGAIVTICDTLIVPGIGYTYGYNFFVQFFKEMFEDDQSKLFLHRDFLKPVKTQLKEIYDKMGWGEMSFETGKDPNNPDSVVSRLRDNFESYNEKGNRITIFAEDSGTDKAEVEAKVAKKALLYLESMGITQETITKAKSKGRINETPESLALMQKVVDTLQMAGRSSNTNYGNLRFSTVYKDRKVKGVQRGAAKTKLEMIIDQDPGTSKAYPVVLGAMEGENPITIKLKLMQEFLRKQGVKY